MWDFFVKVKFDIYFISFSMHRANYLPSLRQIAYFTLEFVHFVHDRTTPNTYRKSEVVAMHANGVSIYYA